MKKRIVVTALAVLAVGGGVAVATAASATADSVRITDNRDM
ncbi:hypothetical protein [Nonomuraea sp. NPDC050643]